MKTITSKNKLLNKLQKNNLLTNGRIFYLSDFHKSKVGKVVANKIINERLVEPTTATKHWFEKEWKLRKPIREHLGVKIYKDVQRNQFFFNVKKGEYYMDTYDICLKKIDYLSAIGEPLI